MNAIKLTGIVAAGALLASSAAFAGPNWTYLEGAYTQANEVGDNDENTLTSIGGSFGFAEKYHLQAAYGDGKSGDQDIDGYEFAFGVNPAVTDNTDFVTQIYYSDFEDDESNIDFSLDGVGVRIGLRSMYTDNVELSAYGFYFDGSAESGSQEEDVKETGAQIGGQYYWTEAFSIGLDALLSDSSAVRFSARWNF